MKRLLYLMESMLWRCILLLLIILSSSSSASNERLPFTLGIRDSFMIAHSFHNDPHFGPAGGLVCMLFIPFFFHSFQI